VIWRDAELSGAYLKARYVEQHLPLGFGAGRLQAMRIDLQDY